MSSHRTLGWLALIISVIALAFGIVAAAGWHLDTALLVAVVGFVGTLGGTLGGIELTQRNQERLSRQQASANRLSTIRNDRIEHIVLFLSAAIAVEEAAETHAPLGLRVVADGLVKQLWLRERAIYLFCGETTRSAAKSYASKLKDAVNNGTGNGPTDKHYENERWQFLQAARSELEIPDLPGQ
jgi:hypothetical protein